MSSSTTTNQVFDMRVLDHEDGIPSVRSSVFPGQYWKRMINGSSCTKRICECFASLPAYQVIFKFCRTADTYYVYDQGIWKERGKKDYTDLYMAYKELVKMIDLYTYELKMQHSDLIRSEDKKAAQDLEKKIEDCRELEKKLEDSTFLTKCFTFQYVEFAVDDFTSGMDASKQLFAFSDCVYDLDNGLDLHHHPGRHIMTHTGYPFPRERNPEVEKELWGLFNSMFHDERDALYMLKTIAYCLHGDKSKLDLFFVWVGKGGNGKGIMYKLIKRAFGDYFKPLTSAYLTQKRAASSGPQPELANKKGKRIVISTEPETEDGERYRTDKIKELSDDIEVRGLYQKPFTFSPQFGLIIQANQDPVFTADKKRPNNAILRRYRGLYFPIIFVPDPDPNNPNEKQSDPTVKCKCDESDDYRDSFIRILLDVYEEHVKGKTDLEAPPNVKSYVNNVFEDNDEYGQFLRDCVEQTGDEADKVPRERMLAAFCSYVDKRVDASAFTKTLRNDYGLLTNKRNWLCVKLIPQEQDLEEVPLPQPSFFGTAANTQA